MGPPVLGCFSGTLVTFYPAVKTGGILCVDLLAEEGMRGVRNLIMAREYLEGGHYGRRKKKALQVFGSDNMTSLVWLQSLWQAWVLILVPVPSTWARSTYLKTLSFLICKMGIICPPQGSFWSLWLMYIDHIAHRNYRQYLLNTCGVPGTIWSWFDSLCFYGQLPHTSYWFVCCLWLSW